MFASGALLVAVAAIALGDEPVFRDGEFIRPPSVVIDLEPEPATSNTRTAVKRPTATAQPKSGLRTPASLLGTKQTTPGTVTAVQFSPRALPQAPLKTPISARTGNLAPVIDGPPPATQTQNLAPVKSVAPAAVQIGNLAPVIDGPPPATQTQNLVPVKSAAPAAVQIGNLAPVIDGPPPATQPKKLAPAKLAAPALVQNANPAPVYYGKPAAIKLQIPAAVQTGNLAPVDDGKPAAKQPAELAAIKLQIPATLQAGNLAPVVDGTPTAEPTVELAPAKLEIPALVQAGNPPPVYYGQPLAKHTEVVAPVKTENFAPVFLGKRATEPSEKREPVQTNLALVSASAQTPELADTTTPVDPKHLSPAQPASSTADLSNTAEFGEPLQHSEEPLIVTEEFCCDACSVGESHRFHSRFYPSPHFSSGNMGQHIPYIAHPKNYYYFRPYNWFHIREQQQEVMNYGGDPRHPYANEVFKSIYQRFEEEPVVAQ